MALCEPIAKIFARSAALIAKQGLHVSHLDSSLLVTITKRLSTIESALDAILRNLQMTLCCKWDQDNISTLLFDTALQNVLYYEHLVSSTTSYTTYILLDFTSSKEPFIAFYSALFSLEVIVGKQSKSLMSCMSYVTPPYIYCMCHRAMCYLKVIPPLTAVIHHLPEQ